MGQASQGRAPGADARGLPELTKRSEHNPVVKYASVPPAMFDFILGKTMSKMAGVEDATCTPRRII